MKLPNRERAFIPQSKLKDYLLSETHPIGKSKAKFFRMFGYDELNKEHEMIGELDLVVLTHDIEDQNLQAGDIGTVVHCYVDSMAYEVEFVTAEAKTIAVLTLTTKDIRLFEQAEILHSREFASLAA